MANFYKNQRIKLNVLIESDGKPTGGNGVLTKIIEKNYQRKLNYQKAPMSSIKQNIQLRIKKIPNEFFQSSR